MATRVTGRKSTVNFKWKGGNAPLRFRTGPPAYTQGRATGANYDLSQYWWDNSPILGDNGQARTHGRTASLRRHYAHIVGRSEELREAAWDMYEQARANGGAIRETGQWLRHLKKPQREKSIEGKNVDYVVYNTDPAAMAIEFGRVYKSRDGTLKRLSGSFAMTNAAKGRPINKQRFTIRKPRRHSIERRQ